MTKGRKEGRKKGRKVGRKEGRKEGRKKEDKKYVEMVRQGLTERTQLYIYIYIYLLYWVEGFLAAVTLALLHPDHLRRRLCFHAKEMHQKAICLLQAIGAPNKSGISRGLQQMPDRNMKLTRRKNISLGGNYRSFIK